jgi:predicted methyltransferase
MFALWSRGWAPLVRRTPERSRFIVVDPLTKEVLRSFSVWGKDSLDLHELFEAGGNDPEARTAVFDIVERLVREGMLREEGNDFYSLTEKGKQLAQQI